MCPEYAHSLGNATALSIHVFSRFSGLSQAFRNPQGISALCFSLEAFWLVSWKGYLLLPATEKLIVSNGLKNNTLGKRLSATQR